MNGRQYAVALALVDSGEAVMGVLGCPNLPAESVAGRPDAGDACATAPPGVVFAARRGAGCVCGPLGALSPLEGAVEVSFGGGGGGPPSYMESYGDSLVAAHGTSAAVAASLGVEAPPTRLDSQAKYGAVARGDAQLYMRFPPEGYTEKVWDHAAGAAVIREAGGKISDASGAPLDFGEGRYLSVDRAILAYPPHLEERVLSAVGAALPPRGGE